MKDPTRRQIMMMADEAGITDYEAAARLVRLALAVFRSAPAPEQLAQIIYERAMVAAAGPQGRFWPSWAELPESDARAHAMAAAGAILAAWGRHGPEPAGGSSPDQTNWKELCRELLAVFERYDGESNLDGILLDLAASGNDCIGRACEFFGVPRLLPHRTPEKLPQEG